MGKSIFDSLPTDKSPNGAIYYSLGIFGKSEWEFIHLKKNQVVRLHYHDKTSSMFYIVKGKGTFQVGKKRHIYKPGKTFRVPKKTKHSIHAKSETLFLAIETPPIYNSKTRKNDVRY